MNQRQRIRRTLLFIFLIAFPLTINYYSPYLIMDAAAKGIASFSFLLWSTWLVTSLIFGRAGCGYFCPLGAGQETLHAMSDKPLVRVKYIKVLKYIIAVAWVGAIVAALVSAGGLRSVQPLYNTENLVSIDSLQGNILYVMVLSIALLPAFFMGKRAFCHYFCPFGVLNIIGTKIANLLHLPVLHLKSETDRCTKCGKCTQVCQMSLPVKDMVQHGSMANTECILCGMCVDQCKFGAIHYAWKREANASVEVVEVLE
jgi:polyferredoxin